MAPECMKRVAVYTRTSPKANLGSANAARQCTVAQAAIAAISEHLKQYVERVSEVVSGSMLLVISAHS